MMPEQTPNAPTNAFVSGDAAILARRYAHALYDLAQEKGQLDVIADELRSLRDSLARDGEFWKLAAHPRLTRAGLAGQMRTLAANAKLSPLSANLLVALADNRRISNLGGIIAAFMARLASARGEVMAEVQTAQALSQAQQDQLTAQLQKMAGGKVHLSIRQVPELLGGLTVKIGSRLIDASLRGKLARIERQLKSQQAAA